MSTTRKIIAQVLVDHMTHSVVVRTEELIDALDAALRQREQEVLRLEGERVAKIINAHIDGRSRQIDYQFIDGPRGSWKVKVILDDKVVGAIKIVEGGFAYFPNGSKRGFAGEAFKSVREVQQSLETPKGEGNDGKYICG